MILASQVLPIRNTNFFFRVARRIVPEKHQSEMYERRWVRNFRQSGHCTIRERCVRQRNVASGRKENAFFEQVASIEQFNFVSYAITVLKQKYPA